ncbi:histone deacetylase [Nocardia sp. NPDC052112]|uniref:histone deacetylase n=1 Tax=Nocardia sp. NPDC052112 TaxID=3155646 RepID=UPI00343EFD6E
MTETVWYASYGSNMHSSRLRCYLAGGTPDGGAVTLPGCRHRAEPLRSEPLTLAGLQYFATESLTWTGGRAFYDPDAHGTTAARAHLVTVDQFCDIAAQEMYRTPGTDLDLGEAITHGRLTLGPGRYETVVCTGTFEGHPVLTITAPWRYTDLPGNPPSAAYIRHLAAGLTESHSWTVEEIAAYIATRPGAVLGWTAATIVALLESQATRTDTEAIAPPRTT